MSTTATTTGLEQAGPPSGDSEWRRRQKLERGKYGQYNDPVHEPGEAIKMILSENISMTGGTAAVLLQIANRGVGLGVAAHSSFTLRPIERARRNFFYIYVMAFGTVEERRIVTDATHRAHSRVQGANYDANDVDLQLWVAATMYWSFIVSYEGAFGKLDEETADEAYREFSVMATGVRVPAEKWPKDRKAFQEYWDKTIASLEITEEAKSVAQDVLWPQGKNLPWAAWAYATVMGPNIRSTTAELLPEHVRNAFGIPSTPYTRWISGLSSIYARTVYRALPDTVRHFLKDYHMKNFRERITKGSKM